MPGSTARIVLTYQGTGVINFAAAAMATVAALRLQTTWSGPAHAAVAVGAVVRRDVADVGPVVVALAVAAALGALVDVAVSRPLRNAPVLAKVIAAIGVTVTLSAAIALKYGTELRLRATVLPTRQRDHRRVPRPRRPALADRLSSSCSSAVLAVWFARSRTGVAIQAAAENERAASFARLSPPALGTVTWVLATMFVSVILIIAGPPSAS